VLDPRKVGFEDKKSLIEQYNELILSTKGIFTSSAGYREEVTKRYFMNTEGTYIEQEMLIIQAGFGATAREGTLTQTVRVSIGGNDDFTRIRNRHSLIEERTRRAVELLKAEPATGGVCTVILDPDVAGVFTHEAFGHLSEADSIQFNQSMRDEMKLGRRLGREMLNIIDDGSIPGAPGSYPFDDEGVASRGVHLIREGVLAGRLHSRESAADFSEPVSGSMRASNFHHSPLVRQSNICIQPGTSTFEEMLGSVKHGYYLVGMAGGQTIGDMFTFGTQYGFEISNGRLGRMVRDVNLSGNVFKTLMEISMIGNDLVMTESGGCGKNGQMLTASGYGAPHIKLDRVTVGGR
jgi:TldD protein